jgi:primosomal protein N' (replication factor Y)
MTDGEQLALPGAVRVPRKRAATAPPAAAAELPVATVVVDLPLAHLDRSFDYLVPERVSHDAVPGARVRLRFSGQLVDGFIVERRDASEHAGKLAFLDRVVSPEPILGPDLHALCRTVADRWAGTLADVLRLAIPPRHAKAEAAEPEPPPLAPGPVPADAWGEYAAGPSYLAALTAGAAARAVWTPAPGSDWCVELAQAALATLRGGRGALLLVPDARDAARVDRALTAVLPAHSHVVLTADLGPRLRYARWLRVRRGQARVVVGTRAAAFAPVHDLGLVAMWDDGDDVYAEPRAPYPHAREVLLLRAHQSGCAALLGGHSHTAEAGMLLSTGWAQPIQAPREVVRARSPRLEVAGDDSELARDPAARVARLPSSAWRVARAALAAARPVLVQVPRRGYAPSLACERCRAAARCDRCAGPLAVSASGVPPRCRWCGLLAADWRCRACAATKLRATTVGAGRTAEELGRAFPGVPVRTSGGDAVLDMIGDGAQLVVATPGAEPVAAGGYGAALLLDAWTLLSRPGMRAGEEALRRWCTAVALVRPAPDGGHVVLVGDPGLPVVQAMVRADPQGWLERELAERTELGLPPAVRMAAVSGAPGPVAELLDAATLPETVEVLGPVEAEPGQVRAVLRAPRAAGGELARALKAAQAVRSARRAEGSTKVELDPLEPL